MISVFFWKVLQRVLWGLLREGGLTHNHDNLLKKPYTSAFLLPPINSERAEDIPDEEEEEEEKEKEEEEEKYTKEEETEPKDAGEKGDENKRKEEGEKEETLCGSNLVAVIRIVKQAQSYCKFIPAEDPVFDRLYYHDRRYGLHKHEKSLKINFLKDFLELSNLERTTNAYDYLISTKKIFILWKEKKLVNL